jgi:hypothetical protein
MHSQSPLHVGAFVTWCIRNVEYFDALWRIVHRCIFMHSWRGAFTRIVVHVDSGAFLYSCILMHSHVSHLQMHFISTQPVWSPSGPCCMLPCVFSFESARLLLCMFVWSTSLAHLCAFSRILRYFYAFSRIMKQSWSKYHAIIAPRMASKSGKVPPSWTGIRIYAHECIIVRMHQNATH